MSKQIVNDKKISLYDLFWNIAILLSIWSAGYHLHKDYIDVKIGQTKQNELILRLEKRIIE